MGKKDKRLHKPKAAHMKCALPPGWIAKTSRSHPDRVYYYNTITRVSTWLLPDGKQTDEGSENGSSASQAKKEHRAVGKSHHSHRDAPKMPEQQVVQQPIQAVDDDGDDDDLFDLTEEEIRYIPPLLNNSVESIQNDASKSEGPESSPSGAKRQKRKKKNWKSLWDSPSGSKLETVSSSAAENEEACALTAEELQIIRFPRIGQGSSESSSGKQVSSSSLACVKKHARESVSPNAQTHLESNCDLKYSAPCTVQSKQPVSQTTDPLSSSLLYSDIDDSSLPTDQCTKSKKGNTDSVRGANNKTKCNELSSTGGKVSQTGSSVTVEYRAGMKRKQKENCTSGSETQRNDRVIARTGDKSTSSATVVESRRGVKGRKSLKPKQSDKLSELYSSTSSSVSFIPRVLSSAKPTVESGRPAVESSVESARPTVESSVESARPTVELATAAVTHVNKTIFMPPNNDTHEHVSLTPGCVGSGGKTQQNLAPVSDDFSMHRGKLNSALVTNVTSFVSTLHSNVTSSRQDLDSHLPASGKSVDGEQVEQPVSDKVSCSSECRTLTVKWRGTASGETQYGSQPSPVVASSHSHAPQPLDVQKCPSPVPGVVKCDESQVPIHTVSQTNPSLLQHAHGDSVPHSQQPLSTFSTTSSSSSTATQCLDIVPSTAFHFTPVAEGGAAAFPGAGQQLEREADVAMEVDDFICDWDDSNDQYTEDQIMMDIQELRENFKPDMNAKVVGGLTESVQHSLTNRPVTPLPATGSARKLVYTVLDTNILMGPIRFLQDLRDMRVKDHGWPYLIIPWIVLQELDALKNSSLQKSQKAQNGIRFIHSCLLAKHPQMRGQTPAEAADHTEDLQITCNDDRILQCCLQCQEKYGETHVILLTNDLNLENKALVMGIRSYDTERLLPLLTTESASPPAVPNEDSLGRGTSPPESGQGQGSAQSNKRNIEDDCITNTGRNTPSGRTGLPIGERNSDIGRSTVSGDRDHPSRRRNILLSSARDPEEGRNRFPDREDPAARARSEKERQQKLLKDELVCEVKSVLQSALSAVVEREMREAFGDMWHELVYKKPPWSAYDLTLVLKKHWIAVFCLKWGRALQSPVEYLANHLRPGKDINLSMDELQQLLQNSLQLVREVDKCSPCQQAVRQLETMLHRGQQLMSGSITLTAAPSVSGHVEIPKTNSSEEVAAIEQLFQAVWSAIFNCCNNVERMLETSLGSGEVNDIKNTLHQLLPQVTQIQEQFNKCLSYSPLGLERHVDDFTAFCSCLNEFFLHANIPSPPVSSVPPGNMIVFMADREKRVTLFNGLGQLEDMVHKLQELISRLPV